MTFLREGWSKGSVKLLGHDSDKEGVLTTCIILRSHPALEIYMVEKNSHCAEIYLMEIKVARPMSKIDEARLRGRAHVGYTRTFEKLEQWFRDIDEERVVGKLPGDLLTPEGETGILGHFELWRPGSTSYLANKFGNFLKLQAPIMMERLRTRGSWDSDCTGLQFIVANVTNRGIKDVDLSKTEGDILDALAAENDYSDEDDVFNEDRKVELVDTKKEPIEAKEELPEYQEEESQDGEPEADRKVRLVDDEEIPARTVKNEYFECDTSCQGKIRAVKKENLLTEAGIRAILI